MAADDEVMSFEITDQDLEEEFNFDRRRPRQSKNRAIYGIWAENSDEDEDAQPSLSSAGVKRKKGGLAYSGPVGFVSAGIQQAGKKNEEAKKDDDDNDDEPIGKAGSSSEEEGGHSGFGFGARGRSKKSKGFEQEGGQIAGLRTAHYRPQNAGLGKGFGDWEKHTRGIGAKLLMKMGYEAGKGLGKNLQGRSNIVESFQRKGRGAIGAYGTEGGGPKAEKKKQVDSEEEEEKEFKEKLHQWKKGGSQKKIKYVYKTADQVLEDGKWRKVSQDVASGTGSGAGKVKVIDMTGREERVLSGYHAIGAAKKRPDEDTEITSTDANSTSAKPVFEVPELLHNINMILDTCEENLITADRKLRHHKNRVEVLKLEEEKLAQLVDSEKEEINTLEDMLAIVEKLEVLHEEKRLDLDSAAEMFMKMSRKYPNEYHLYEIPHIATTIVAPLLKEELRGWQVLDAPFKFKTKYGEWKEILLLSSTSEADPFYNLIWESWMPSVRGAIQQWNTRNSSALIDFLRGWNEIIPMKIKQNLLDLLILPKLQDEVSQWDPMSDSVPIHSWLHPWLDVLGSQLEIVYPTIRQKMASALKLWHPSDKSAKLVLMPWRDVFEQGSLHAFLVKNIVPKLALALDEMIINPTQQNMSHWNWVIDWQDFIPLSTLVPLLDKHFFHKWIQVLASWLNQNPNYADVMKWFKGWKDEFNKVPNLLEHQSIQSILNQALQMMNHAVTGGAALPIPSVPFMTQQPPMPAAPPPPSISPMVNLNVAPSLAAASSASVPETYKELVAKRCGERGIIFMPVPGRKHEGKQVYRCGNCIIYIDRNIIFVQRSGMWIHVSLDDLISNAL